MLYSSIARAIYVAVALVLLPTQSFAKDFWWPYLASYESGPGSTRVNLGLKKQVPVSEYPYLVVTGPRYKASGTEGFPGQAEIDRLNVLSTKIVDAIAAVSPSIYAGTFTHQSEQLHYVYVKKRDGIESALKIVYAKSCQGCKVYTNIKHDPTWSTYSNFLYPNPRTLEFYRQELRHIKLDEL